MTALIPMSFPLGCSWYVATVRQQAEFDVADEIAKLGFLTYVPRCRRHRTIARRKVIAVWPLFTGYVFAFFDTDRHHGTWEKIGDIDGVSSILTNNNIPMRVKTEDIQRLRRSENAGAFDFTIPATTFKVGEQYRIAEGPFTNFIARFRAASSKKRAKIALEFFGGIINTEIDACFLEEAS